MQIRPKPKSGQNRNPATFWPEPDLGWICKNGHILPAAKIQYSTSNVGSNHYSVYVIQTVTYIELVCSVDTAVNISLVTCDSTTQVSPDARSVSHTDNKQNFHADLALHTLQLSLFAILVARWLSG